MISIVVPVLNEELKICKLLSNLDKLTGDFDVVFADGGSTDSTLKLIGTRWPVVKCQPGRALQMNYAASITYGDVLLFLHSDSILPPDACYQISNVLNDGHDAGCFRLVFDSHNPLMKLCGHLSNLRVKLRKIAFGDQGIFMRRELFDVLGGFPDIPIMEDYKMSELIMVHTSIGITEGYILTSARRFESGGILRTMWKMQRIQRLYKKGIDQLSLAKIYR
ncbi:MAG: TIGR04283 family arsenosugar biosynthesis glycosyltransferase [Synergistaceae bacterium]|jgi:rSAM/selenodomain-associated transferase 2|nr:TIGR04283 family arsenosugar biosynthesis glycosyltransferase [Synergistaceae bacterium]